jgi:hypothetical protein
MSSNTQAQPEQTTQPSHLIFAETSESYDVTFFTVRNIYKDGDVVYFNFAKYFATIEQARDCKSAVLRSFPDCFISGCTCYYISEDDNDRLNLLSKIIPAQNQHV